MCLDKKYSWMVRPLSIDLRERIIDAYDQGGISQQAVAQRFCVSVEFVKKSSGSAVSWAILDRSIVTVAASPRLLRVTANV